MPTTTTPSTSDVQVSRDRGSHRFVDLCCRHGLHYDGRPLPAVPWSWFAEEFRPPAVSITLVKSYLALQRWLYFASAQVRDWVDACCTEWGRRLNHAAEHVKGPFHLWCRGDEVPAANGSTLWAEQEVDDGGLGPDGAMEWAFLGSRHLFTSYVRALEAVGWGRDDRPLVIVVGESYRVYLPWMRYLGHAASNERGRPVEVVFEGDPDFATRIGFLIRAEALFHNFFESYRHDRFLRPHWIQLFEAWCEERIRMWPAPAIFHEWKGWPVVFHHPDLLEEPVRRILVDQDDYVSLVRHLPQSSFVGDLPESYIRSASARIVVKPAFGGGSYGVRAGAEMGGDRLRRMLRRAGGRGHLIVQQLGESQQVRGCHTKFSPHYFLEGQTAPIVAHVMARPSRIVHGQGDARVAVMVLP